MTTTASITCLDDLKSKPQWVCYLQDKTPINPRTTGNAKSNIPATWTSYDVARKLWASDKEKYAGIGFELLKAQRLIVIDLDHCIENGVIAQWALDIVNRINSYAETSPSGTGIHIWLIGEIDTDIGNDTKSNLKIEIYSHDRYLTITGKQVDGTPDTFQERQEEITLLHSQVTEARRIEKEKNRQREKVQAPRQDAQSGDSRYGLKALEDECADLASTLEGGRNSRLNQAAFAMGQLVGGNELTQATAEQALYAAATSIGLGDAEIEKTMRSGIESGMRSPRKAPESAPGGNGGPNSYYIPPPVAQPEKPFHLTDLGNAERFALRYKDTVRWCEDWKTWMVYNGKCWEPDKAGRVDQLAKIIVRGIYKEAAATDDDDMRKRLAKHAAASESNRSVRAMLDRSKSELPATPEDFNKHLYLLNCENGTLDLQHGELRPHRSSDMLTRCLKINYNPLAIAERWQSFLEKFLVDGDLIAFMKQALGMSLCGDTSEQCLFICHGMGSNGKTTMLETVRIIMDSYALAANIETFQVRKNETIGNDIAELYAARLVTASETKLGGRLNEAFVKKATGKEPLRARRLHENEFQFMPEFTLWLAVNHKPVVLDTSRGMWRRVHFVPFNVTIEDDQADKHFGDKLLEEAEGILAWLVQGCMEWIKQGRLTAPKIVLEATAGYRAEMDIVANFFRDECIFAPKKVVTTKKLIERFESWCGHNSEKFDAKILKNSLKERGLHSQRGTGGAYYWQDIGLLDNADNSQEELFSEGDSEGSEGSEPKNKVNSKLKNPPDATLNSPSLPSLPSLPEKEKVLADLFDQRDEQQEQVVEDILNLFHIGDAVRTPDFSYAQVTHVTAYSVEVSYMSSKRRYEGDRVRDVKKYG